MNKNTTKPPKSATKSSTSENSKKKKENILRNAILGLSLIEAFGVIRSKRLREAMTQSRIILDQILIGQVEKDVDVTIQPN